MLSGTAVLPVGQELQQNSLESLNDRDGSVADVKVGEGFGGVRQQLPQRVRKPVVYGDYDYNPNNFKQALVAPKVTSKPKVETTIKRKGENAQATNPLKKPKLHKGSVAFDASHSQELKGTVSSSTVIKDIRQEELEESMIAYTRKASSTYNASIKKSKLSLGPDTFRDQREAMKKSVADCTVLLNWSLDGAKLIGSLCKVYWDGENHWYYARILNYDNINNLHFVSMLASTKMKVVQ